MDRNSSFYAQVQLLLRVLLFVAQEPCFAFKMVLLEGLNELSMTGKTD